MSSAAKVETSDCEKSQEEVAVSVCAIETKEVEAQLNLLKKETQEYTSRCAAEARNLMEDVELETRNLDIVEREADEIRKTSKLKLQDAIKQTEEETQTCAYGLMAVIDSVSKHKEYVQSKIFEMKRDVSETAVAASDTHKSCLQSQFGFLSDANQQSETALQ